MADLEVKKIYASAVVDVSGTKFIIVFDVNGDNVYYATSIA